ncbi:hypothetical protein STCU_10252 [Strigomonas culicis]|uniref:Uncharacterized protein n=1 Tax=Strigomonas culicis TaxID=28005 RepID=S9V555_9TRYP|nr:hypothetical protein STCU_10252 [Strigomonas culicis]|eukprot:EPY18015.1 hypothetical protein STCU_10252 [Strigomonas culicis]
MASFAHLSRLDNDDSEFGAPALATPKHPPSRRASARYRVPSIPQLFEASAVGAEAPIPLFQIKCRLCATPLAMCDCDLTSDSSGSGNDFCTASTHFHKEPEH